MFSSNGLLEKSDLIRPLSFEALEYFASGTIPLGPRDRDSLRLKFVRLGETVIVGSMIRFGGVEWLTNDQHRIKHLDLVDKFREPGEIRNQALIDMGKEIQLNGYMAHDAGMALIIAEGPAPRELGLTGASHDFGRADEKGRQRTIEVAQRVLGSEIRVFAV